MDEQLKTQNEKSENRAISTMEESQNETSEMATKFSPFCRDGCVICNCEHLKEIHEWRPGLSYIELSEKIKNELGLEFSKDQLWRHFRNFNEKVSGKLAQHIRNFEMEFETLAEHTKRLCFLGKIAYEDILARVDNGKMQFTVDDFVKIQGKINDMVRDPAGQLPNNVIIMNMLEGANKIKVPLNQTALPLGEAQRIEDDERAV